MLTLIFTLVILGLLFWVLTLLPITEPFITIIKVVLIIIAIATLLNAFGVNTGIHLLR